MSVGPYKDIDDGRGGLGGRLGTLLGDTLVLGLKLGLLLGTSVGEPTSTIVTDVLLDDEFVLISPEYVAMISTGPAMENIFLHVDGTFTETPTLQIVLLSESVNVTEPPGTAVPGWFTVTVAEKVITSLTNGLGLDVYHVTIVVVAALIMLISLSVDDDNVPQSPL
jgi:hypothetical protein